MVQFDWTELKKMKWRDSQSDKENNFYKIGTSKLDPGLILVSPRVVHRRVAMLVGHVRAQSGEDFEEAERQIFICTR